MNRQQRRAARAKAKNATVDPVVAIHEAGHAVARYLTAEMMGLSKEESVSSIDVHVTQEMPKGKSVDGKMVTSAQATTFGPLFSKEIDAVRLAVSTANGWSDLPPEELAAKLNTLENMRDLLETAREQGCDVEKWLRARAIIMVAGATAESLYREVPWHEVWDGYEAEGDKRDLIGDLMSSGLVHDELANAEYAEADAAFAWFRDKITGTPGVLDALNALASRINKPGTIPHPVAALPTLRVPSGGAHVSRTSETEQGDPMADRRASPRVGAQLRKGIGRVRYVARQVRDYSSTPTARCLPRRADHSDRSLCRSVHD